MRYFLAINLTKEIKFYLEDLILELEKNNQIHDIKWTEPKNLHLTMGFIENISESTSQELLQKFENEFEFTEFTLRLDEIGIFPNSQAPKTIVIALQDTEKKLSPLRNIINQTFEKFNIPTDNRKFSPHITLGRIKWGRGHMHLDTPIQKMEFQVKSIDFMQSELTPTGPIYTKLKSLN
ncbi:RNA 2',3'-cyclic phosphodiesterase [Candidatus Falkowbacteria bacterium]|jgi:RNA 2',3'-cyclic 3'-phosphodiesterase|nr:RNA 2',3'-cyclic phosphodiesterase [Candidatus Falkowbacteria bacterium]MBT5502696.1 RNA 2',3'-cyclic phosphodiesterase [Candidatus Falkowbacteria bacterium]MBT6573520.1 RNA 2',3'-cyclic phosphodiesterase [Candidatus Falkowbacteria bacterium]MBT7348070.1 RNA 2',3'-cyclic phosphodiesterase [Candidatus Falkowbacteria bacterium]MBT7501095.1 RNA 2',3'-cyclic phosphodiesterase [Candidatus Falkowbacteria bacterium]